MQVVKSAKILIAEDTATNLGLLKSILERSAYQVTCAQDGEQVLHLVEQNDFDLILLDIMMPEMDGFTTCACLKASNKSHIPVIFISSKDGMTDKAMAFGLGAVDYITKPFDDAEILLRIRNQLVIAQYKAHLEQMVADRTQQLIHADRLVSLGTFASAIVHDINNPITYIIGTAKLLEETLAEIVPILRRHEDEIPNKALLKYVIEAPLKLKTIGDNGERIAAMVKNIKKYAKQGELERSVVGLTEVIDDAILLVKHKSVRADTQITHNVDPSTKVLCHPQKLSQVFVNIFDNACDAIKATSKSGHISISVEQSGNFWQILVTDDGPGMPRDVAEKIFEPFFTTKGKEEGTGLGLYIVRGLIEEHGGMIKLETGPGEGTTFKIRLPIAK